MTACRCAYTHVYIGCRYAHTSTILTQALECVNKIIIDISTCLLLIINNVYIYIDTFIHTNLHKNQYQDFSLGIYTHICAGISIQSSPRGHFFITHTHLRGLLPQAFLLDMEQKVF